MVRVIQGLERASQRARAELEIASGVHAALVPPIDLTAAGAEVFGRSFASSNMGGDLIDAVIGGERGERLDVLLADVSGHGVGAGIVMAIQREPPHAALAVLRIG